MYEQLQELLNNPSRINITRFRLKIDYATLPHKELTILAWTLGTCIPSQHKHIHFNESALPTSWFDHWFKQSLVEMRHYQAIDFILSINLFVKFKKATQITKIRDDIVLDIESINKLDKITKTTSVRTLCGEEVIWLVHWIHYSRDHLKHMDQYQLDNVRGCLYQLKLSKKHYYEPYIGEGRMNSLKYWCAKFCEAREFDYGYLLMSFLSLHVSEDQLERLDQLKASVIEKYPNTSQFLYG